MRTVKYTIQSGESQQTVEFSSDSEWNLFIHEAMSMLTATGMHETKNPWKLSDFMLKFHDEEIDVDVEALKKSFTEAAVDGLKSFTKAVADSLGVPRSVFTGKSQIDKSVNSGFSQEIGTEDADTPQEVEINKEAFFRP